MHQPAVDAVALLRAQGHTLCLVPQNLYEFWVVCTRPLANNGYKLPLARELMVRTLLELSETA